MMVWPPLLYYPSAVQFWRWSIDSSIGTLEELWSSVLCSSENSSVTQKGSSFLNHIFLQAAVLCLLGNVLWKCLLMLDCTTGSRRHLKIYLKQLTAFRFFTELNTFLFLICLQCWENGIILCRKMSDQYESYYDYRNLSKMRVMKLNIFCSLRTVITKWLLLVSKAKISFS